MIAHQNRRGSRYLGFIVLLTVFAACERPGGTDSAATSSRDDAADTSAESTAENSAQPAASAGTNVGPGAGNGRAVVAETLAYAEVGDVLVKGHFVFPEDMVDPLPAVLLIHEWWGLDERTRSLADRIAGEGFIVLAADLYSGSTANSPARARELMLTVVENPALATENISKALDWIFTTTGAAEVATVGYGFGGGWSLHTAMNSPDKLDAAVILYGQVSNDDSALSMIEVPVLGLFGEDDSAVLAETVRKFELALDSLGKDYDVEIYPGAKSGFASPGSRNFDPELEQEAWSRMIGFLREHLAPDTKIRN